MAYIAMAYIAMAYIDMAYVVMAYIGMAYIVMAYIGMAYIVMDTSLNVGSFASIQNHCTVTSAGIASNPLPACRHV